MLATDSLDILVNEALTDLNARYRIGDIRPVPIEEIIKSEGGRIVRRFMTIDASLSYGKRGDGFRISVNSAHPAVRQRFSIGHEFGHVVLERASSGVRNGSHPRSCEILSAPSPEAVERTCNKFSARLLIPDEVVGWLADWGILSIQGLRNAARDWAVSLQALAWHVFETAPGDGGIISLRWSKSPGDHGGHSLSVDWAMFPKGPRFSLEQDAAVVATPLLDEMLSCNEETTFREVVVPLPGFGFKRNVHALRTAGSLLLLICP